MRTPEPPGGAAATGSQLRFVIQRHHARRLHYDLLLALDGALKSWALPKGPSLNPSDKRLAIQTEDHPLQYLDFQGIIPRDNYGAGSMVIWDAGTYAASAGQDSAELSRQLEQGSLKITFAGNQVRGAFSLVRTRRGDAENQWLLIKKKDEHATDQLYDAEDHLDFQTATAGAGDDAVPAPAGLYRPMLAGRAAAVFNGPQWIFELKWDGYRAVASDLGSRVDLYSCNGLSFNARFPALHRSLRDIPHDVVLDGEIVALDERGVPLFQALQNYPQTQEGELRYLVFDLLYLNGHETMSLPLLQRKSLIPEVIADIAHVHYCDHIAGQGSLLFRQAVDLGMEGLIAKKADSVHRPGVRSDDWLKIKAVMSQEAVIGGYTAPGPGGTGFGSLILGGFAGGELRYIGNCGSGFEQQQWRRLLDLFQERLADTSPFRQKIPLKGRQPSWLRPDLICEVNFSEWTRSGTMRHPVYKGLRLDKNAVEAQDDEPFPARADALRVDGRDVSISNLEKIYWPAEGYTKYDLLDYFLKMGETMLPYLKDRPQNLHRHPDGIAGKAFYQKNTAGNLPSWIETVAIRSRSRQKTIEYLLCQDEATLLYLANLGCIEINPWLSRRESLDEPDHAVIDLDPSPANTFAQVVEVAQAAKQILDQGRIIGFCKTTGSRGLHIYLPLQPGYTYDEARDFTKVICYRIKEVLPGLTTMERSLKKRRDRIYLDYLQNRQGQTLAAAYCARPKPGATVSTPLAWHEVEPGLAMEAFTIKTVPGPLAELGDLFRGILTAQNAIESALAEL